MPRVGLITFLGAGTAFSFTGGGQAEVVYEVSGANSVVYFDQDGNGSVDLRINMNAVTTLIEADFIF